MIYSADVMQTSNMAGLYTQVCYHRSLLWDREVREIQHSHIRISTVSVI